MGIKIILTGATGMAGEGVLYECLKHPAVDEVLIINRKPAEINHPKLKEIIHENFFDLSAVEDKLSGYDACFFCLGVSSIGMKEPEYYRLTYTLTMNFANAVVKQNKDMVFCYISGASTDSTEKGSSMWARVKGKTENDLMKLPFKAAYNFRPGYMHSHPGLKRTLKAYKYFSWMYPFMKRIMPNKVGTLEELGLGMINAARLGYEKQILEVKDIRILAGRD
jgi:uncharacterized protein YbjT (DUF2867 family)